MSVRGGIVRAAAVTVPPGILNLVSLLATLCRFDHNYPPGSYSGPFIPCERRRGYIEILEIQGRDFWTSF